MSTWENRIVGQGNVSPDDLIPNPGGWRKHPKAQQRALEAVLEKVGWADALIVNRRTGHLINGDLRRELALKHGETTVPVTYIDLSEEDERLVLATFDPLSAMAETNSEALRALIDSVEAPDAAVRDLLDLVASAAGLEDLLLDGLLDPDEAPPLQRDPVSRRGDLWELGDHRLLCGDSTDPSEIRRLVGDLLMQFLWTDPPYGVDYVGKTKKSLRLKNDNEVRLAALLRAVLANVDAVLADRSPVYVASPSGKNSRIFLNALDEVDWHVHQTLVWVKDGFVLGRSDHHYQHELILYGWRGGRARWRGGRTISSVFEIPRPRRSTEHPTIKPVQLVEEQLLHSTVRGDPGIDPFAGSGTTIIAAERLQRRCFAAELDPLYVDVAVRRWETFTGKLARLSDGGKTFEEISEHRNGG